MKREEKALLRTLIAHSAGGGDNLRPFLPPGLAHEIWGWSVSPLSNFSKLLSGQAWIDSIHFSWFFELLKTLPAESRSLFLSLLGQKKAKEVCELLHIPYKPHSFSHFMRPFLLEELKRVILQGVEVTNEEYLPPSDLNILLTLRRNQLLSLVDLLGIYDLSADLRQIVDKELLHKIHLSLSEDQIRFLHYCTMQPLKWLSPKLGLLGWNGTKKSLQHLLHGRGLSRLGKALYSEDESLKWHLLHRFDIGRAGVIEKILRQKQDHTLTPYFKNQVIQIVKRYQS